MGPMHPSGDEPVSPEAAAAPDDTDDLDDEVLDESLDDGAPEIGSRELDESEESDEESDDERAWLIERARKADEYEQLLNRQKAEQREQEAVAYWNERLDQAKNFFAGREADIYASAENSLNPIGYIKEKIAELRSQEMTWYATYRDNREQALWEYTQAQELPRYVARVVEHYKLPKEALEELSDYPPEQIEREAQRMRARLIKERRQAKEIDQLKRKAARLEKERNPLNTGSGRGSATGSDAPLGSDQHYHAIPWVRGR